VAVAWRNLPLWLAIGVGTVAFLIFMVFFGTAGGPGGGFYWFYIFGSLITLVSHVVFFIGVGLYFSVRLRSATAAVTAAIGSVLGLFIFVRFLLSLAVHVVMTAIAGSPYSRIILWYVVRSALRLGIGLLLIWRARCRLRRSIF
jgi:hypothetical protein